MNLYRSSGSNVRLWLYAKKVIDQVLVIHFFMNVLFRLTRALALINYDGGSLLKQSQQHF